MAESAWDPRQYEKFKAQRKLPFLDLADLIVSRPGMTVLDLGCGTGELTHELHERLKAQRTLGVDNADTMLEKSRKFEGEGLSFTLCAIEDFSPTALVDLVFSNAALHFVEDHQRLFPRLAGFLKPGGQFAAHLPSNHTYHTHLLAEDMAGEEPYRTALQGDQYRSAVLLPEEYAVLFHRLGFEEQLVRLQVYTHEFPDWEEVYEWVKGSLLIWYQKRLSPELYERYVREYRERLHERLGDDRPFLFTFRRLLLWARKAERS